MENEDKQEIIDKLDEIIDNQNFRDQIVGSARHAQDMFYGPKVADFLKNQLFSLKQFIKVDGIKSCLF